MKDQEIVELYWARDEKAIEETSKKYGDYCHAIAHRILKNRSDSEECVNDTWLQAWKSLPPQRPSIFSSYLGTITRNLSLSRYRASSAQKRRGDKLAMAYEELAESIPDHCTVEDTVAAKELGGQLDTFLRTLQPRDCCIFVRRYWYMDTILEIAQRYGMAEGTVKSKLHGIRKKLKQYLQQEGYGL